MSDADHVPDAGKMPTEQDYARALRDDLEVASALRSSAPIARQIAREFSVAGWPAAIRRAQASEAAIVRIAKMCNMDSEELPAEEWDRGWADIEALAARIRAGREKGAPTP